MKSLTIKADIQNESMNTIVIPKTFVNLPYAKKQFRAIVTWAKSNHPFYQHWLSTEDGQVPILNRLDVLDNNKILLNGHPVTATTSGSTGIPVKVSWSEFRSNIEQQVSDRFVSWLGGRLTVTRIIHLDQPSNGCLDVKTSVDQQLKMIFDRYHQHKAVAITTYPSNAERLCREIINKELDMSYIQRFGVFAEVFEPYQEALIQQAFPNAQIWSTYSAMEFGIIAGRCPYFPQYHHLFSGKLGIEILNNNDEPCEMGQVGRIVITDYFNQNAPLIRYDIGDLGAWGKCPCGKISFPALSQVLGKIRGTLLHKNGERIPFTELSVAIRDIPGIRQYQVVQQGIEDFDVRIVLPSATVTTHLKDAVKKAFHAHFGYTPKINIIKETAIERSDNGKFYASICKV